MVILRSQNKITDFLMISDLGMSLQDCVPLTARSFRAVSPKKVKIYVEMKDEFVSIDPGLIQRLVPIAGHAIAEEVGQIQIA